ncbi:MAG: hypothetical protein IJ600_02525 [Lachnospiraceae bacterium]|nr:hypothetical protein [Lachnospiraceae bacterium]
MAEKKEITVRADIFNHLQECTEPLELVFGEEFLRLFESDSFIEKIAEIRAELLKEGISMPLLRLRDYARLEPAEFLILSHQKVLYSEDLAEVGPGTLDYLVKKVEEITRFHNTEISANVSKYGMLC